MRHDSKISLVNYSLQSVFWLLFIGVPVYTTPGMIHNPPAITQYALQHLLLIVLFYLNYFSLPKIMRSRGIAMYLLLSLATILVFIFALNLLDYMFSPRREFIFRFGMMVPVFQVYAFSTTFRFLNDHVTEIRRKKELEDERNKAELSFLRSQINPHFLFNTLNNINALIRIAPGKAEESIGMLSDIMRYMLNAGKSGKVPLQEELEYINGYIELQQLRLSSQTDFRFEIKGDPAGLSIEPLVMIAYIENAFKHFHTSSGKNFIHILIAITGKEISLSVENSRSKELKAGEIESGIGLKNAERRLHLLYPGKFVFEQNAGETSYTVKLKLDLSE